MNSFRTFPIKISVLLVSGMILVLTSSIPAEATPEDNSALIEAAHKGDTAKVQVLLEHGANVNHQAEGKETALMQASASGHVEVVKILLENGADVNLKHSSGATALMLTKSESIRHLLKAAGAE